MFGDGEYDGKEDDLFAVGKILFMILYGRPPFSYAILQDKDYKLIADKE